VRLETAGKKDWFNVRSVEAAVQVTLRIVSAGRRSRLAISSAVGSRPITCRKFRQVRKILLKVGSSNVPSRGSTIVAG
jgi:hypothetical protein